MKHTILVVDDETSLASALKGHLTHKNYNTLVAHNVDDAIEIVKNNAVSLILSDLLMPNKTGFDFFREYKEKTIASKVVPFILMTAHADPDSVQSAFEMKIDEVIAKPFDLESMNIVIDYLLGLYNYDESAAGHYYSVPIKEIILSKRSNYAIFLKIDGKYVQVTKSGEIFIQQRLGNFSKKGITHVYLNAEDFLKYSELQFAIADAISKRPIENSKRMRVMHQLMSSISQRGLASQIDSYYLDRSVQALESYISIATRNSQLGSILNTICIETPDLAAQSVLRAVLASSVAYLWGWENSKIQGRIILAALLADVGLKDCKHLLEKNKFDYTVEEVKQYEQHPLRSYEILRHIDGISEEILQVAIQHHENATGLGFPQKLSRSKLHSYSRLISGIDVFIETLLMLERADKNNTKKALDLIHRIQGKVVSEQVIKSLYILLKHTVPPTLEALSLPSATTRIT